MKSVYPLLFTVIVLAANIPVKTFAQCMCSAGVPATPISYVTTLAPTTAATSTINFPMFNPSIGTLACVSLQDTISGVSTTYVANNAPDTVKYKFELNVNNDIEGPGGLSSTPDFSKIYMDTLASNGQAGSYGVNGPDSIFTNAPDSNGTGNTVGYLGTGTVGLTYTIDGGLEVLKGGLNYADTVVTLYSGVFNLTYYWCPAVELATTITNFTATPNGNTIGLQWLANNQQSNTGYVIQISTDGQNFTNLGTTESNASSEGSSAEYQYQYNFDPANVGKLYFRIEEVSPSGKISYSVVVVLNPGATGTGDISYQTFPNPATNSLLFQFNSNQTGNFVLQLVNTAGQIVQQKAVTLAESSQIRLDFNPQPASGLYFLRAADLTHNKSYVSKVFIN
jgi:Secretion system C-terminal sorting domain